MAKSTINRLGIDARMYGLKHAGIGRYVMNLVDRMIKNSDHQWVIFCHPDYAANFSPYAETIPTTVPHYSLAEQISFNRLVTQQHLDLLHVPHFNVPYFYPGPFVVTIHDILWHHVRGGQVTTLPAWKYYLKYLAYRQIISHAIHQAKAILVPSNFVKQDLLTTFNQKELPIHVTYEGIDALKQTDITEHQSNLVYVGSAYPHKNISVIFQAMELLMSKHPELTFTIVGSRSVFLDKIKRQLASSPIRNQVRFAGFQTDEQIVKILKQATCLVHPSKSEGFGLTGLEAMNAGCPVLAANSSCLPEIYQDAAIYFQPDDATTLAHQIDQLISNHQLRQQMINRGYQQIRKYSWNHMVDQTLDVYEHCLGI